jgi:putative endonuclease
MGAWLYLLRCAGGAYYTGTTRADLDQRVTEHQLGRFPGFTEQRRPVVLVYSEYFDQIVDAIAAERKVKGWSRAKKEALMAGDFGRLESLARRRTAFRPHGSRRVASRRSSP